MEVINNCKKVDFDSRIQYYHYINSVCKSELFNDITGSLNLSRDDRYAYKMYREDVVKNNLYDINVDEILTCEDVNDSGYLFPRGLFLDRNFLLGIKTPYYGGSPLFKNGRNIISIDNLEGAYGEFLKDTDELSKQNIYITSLNGLLVYNGSNFIVYDTCSFKTNLDGIDRLERFGSLKDANRREVFDSFRHDLVYYSGDVNIAANSNEDELFDYLKKEHGRVLTKHR